MIFNEMRCIRPQSGGETGCQGGRGTAYLGRSLDPGLLPPGPNLRSTWERGETQRSKGRNRWNRRRSGAFPLPTPRCAIGDAATRDGLPRRARDPGREDPARGADCNRTLPSAAAASPRAPSDPLTSAPSAPSAPRRGHQPAGLPRRRRLPGGPGSGPRGCASGRRLRSGCAAAALPAPRLSRLDRVGPGGGGGGRGRRGPAWR